MSNGPVLFTRPRHDITTRYLYFWNQKAIDLAAKIIYSPTETDVLTIWKRIIFFFRKVRFSVINFFTHEVIDLKANTANRLEFAHQLDDYKPKLIFLNGHGNANTVTGDQNLPLVDKFNVQILTGSIVYAFSCQSAKNLGPLAVSKGVNAYLGYDEDFVFLIDEKSKPEQDQTAKNFLNPAMQITYSLINGKTPTSAHQDSQDAYNAIISNLSTSETSAEDRQMLPYLVWNRDHQVCLE